LIFALGCQSGLRAGCAARCDVLTHMEPIYDCTEDVLRYQVQYERENPVAVVA
jgi:hypothetical protein